MTQIPAARIAAVPRYSAYDLFAEVYDRHWAKSFSSDIQPVISDHILPLIPRGGRILDLCCGSGRLVNWLSQQGYSVVGLDGSPRMLEIAQINAPEAVFMLADARDFRLARPCHAVFSTYDSLNHLPTTSDLGAVFRNVRSVLGPGGYFFFDVTTEKGFNVSCCKEMTITDDEYVCLVDNDYDQRKAMGSSEITLFRSEGGGWNRTDLVIREYVYSEEVIREELLRAGFQTALTFDATEDFGMRRAMGRQFYLAAAGQSH
jgi:SAM-dependent methyltransferase